MDRRTEQKRAHADKLDSDEVRARIIRDTAFLDFSIGILITIYFASENRSMLFYQLIVDKMTFNNKIDVLDGILKGKGYKSADVAKRIRKLKKVRNHIAHTHFVHERHKVMKDPEVIKFMKDWPHTYNREYKTIKRKIDRLGKTKEFAGEQDT